MPSYDNGAAGFPVAADPVGSRLRIGARAIVMTKDAGPVDGFVSIGDRELLTHCLDESEGRVFFDDFRSLARCESERFRLLVGVLLRAVRHDQFRPACRRETGELARRDLQASRPRDGGQAMGWDSVRRREKPREWQDEYRPHALLIGTAAASDEGVTVARS